MKKLTLIVTLLIGVISSAALAGTTSQLVSAEASAVLLNPHFGEVVALENQKAVQSGQTLKVTRISVTKFPGFTAVYVNLESKISADLHGNWQPYGDIVGMIEAGPLGEATVSGLYFKPAAQTP